MLLMGKSTISTGPFSIAMLNLPEGNLLEIMITHRRETVLDQLVFHGIGVF